MSKRHSLKESAVGPRPNSRGLVRLRRSLSESVAVVSATGVDAPADLGARFSSVLSKLGGRKVSADVLFETLKLETLDWGIDNDVDASVVAFNEKPVPAGDER